MSVIDPAGLFNGERLSLLSDEARMAWPHLYCAANSLARMELSPETLRHEVFGRFRKPPQQDRVAQWLQEYGKAWLLFIYQSDDGKTWGQWWTSERYLPRHKLTADKRTPAPDPEMFARWQEEYYKTRKPITTNGCNDFKKLRRGVQGVGEGIGVGSSPLPPGKVNGSLFAEMESTAVVISLDSRIDQVTVEIHERHPKHRRCEPSQVRRSLKTILKRYPERERLAVLDVINRNHAEWCGHPEWRKDGGQFVKGLENWLAPTKGRYLVRPEPVAPNGAVSATNLSKSAQASIKAAQIAFPQLRGG